MTEWENNLISTGIDQLMEYMQSEKEAQVDEAADFLGVDTDTVIRWAEALEDSGLVKVSYTATHGRVIRLQGAEEAEKAEEQIEEAKEEASEKIESARMESERKRIEQFETVLGRLEEVLDKDEKDAEELRGEADQSDLQKIEGYLKDIEATEEDVAELKDDLEDILADIGVIETLRKHRAETVEAREGRPALLKVEGEREHTCPTCDAAFYTRLGLRMHRELFGHGESAYMCDDCGKTFDTEKGLHIHEGMKGHGSGPEAGLFTRIRAVLPGGGTGRFKCAECDTAFEGADELDAHRQETGHRIKGVKCDRCGRDFDTLGALHTHEEVAHHG